jgi:hypothetical protein
MSIISIASSEAFGIFDEIDFFSKLGNTKPKSAAFEYASGHSFFFGEPSAYQ